MLGDFFLSLVINLFTGLGEILSSTFSGLLCPQLGNGQVPPDSIGCFIIQVLYQPFIDAFIQPIFT